jgi:hypothetical protein
MISIDINEIIHRMIKYAIIFFVVGLVCAIVPKHTLALLEIIIIGLSASMIISIYDTYYPVTCLTCPTGSTGICVKVETEKEE